MRCPSALHILLGIGSIAFLLVEKYAIEHFWPPAFKMTATLFRIRMSFLPGFFQPTSEVKGVMCTAQGRSLGRYRIVNGATIFFFREMILDRTPGAQANLFPLHGTIYIQGQTASVCFKSRFGPILLFVCWLMMALDAVGYVTLLAVFLACAFIAFPLLGLWMSMSEAKSIAQDILAQEENRG